MTCLRSHRVLMANLGLDLLFYAPTLTPSRQSSLPDLRIIKEACINMTQAQLSSKIVTPALPGVLFSSLTS